MEGRDSLADTLALALATVAATFSLGDRLIG
jgi:hypothetical protein